MSVHPFPRRMIPVPPVEPYYQHEKASAPQVCLRPLTALEQMYAYWGSDQV
jgi:hypothetical protein